MARTLASQRLLELTPPDGACVTEKGEAVELSLRRSTLYVAVTVPVTVLEWFVEASDRSSGASVQDWCDYEGYDSTPVAQLDRDMADDVGTFVARLLNSELRLDRRGSSNVVLQWKIGDGWEQAIPLRHVTRRAQ
jgi:hypothetical protein